MKSRITIRVILASVLLLAGIYWLGFEVTQKKTISILVAYGLAFFAYFCLIFSVRKAPELITLLLILGVLLRVLLVLGFPTLSDDIYRFVWDGKMIHEGVHPLAYKPSTFLELNPSSWFHETYSLLNSQEYFTVYPPLSQVVFYLSAFSSSWLWSSVIMKLVLLGFELGTIFVFLKLLKWLTLPSFWALLYFLNPLIIIELMGNLHYEGIMVFFLASSLLALVQNKHGLSGFLFACSIGVKLLPLMFIPLLYTYLRKNAQELKQFFLSLMLTLGCLFLPFLLSLDVGNFLNSLNLYFQKFEFNASIYYLLRTIGFGLTGYNQIAIIGPLLSVITLIAILRISVKDKILDMSSLIYRMYCCFAIYLFLATTVHPWYLCMLVFLAIISKRLWPIIWSGVVVWSYTTYGHPTFEQNMTLILLEYVIVSVFIIAEFRNSKYVKLLY